MAAIGTPSVMPNYHEYEYLELVAAVNKYGLRTMEWQQMVTALEEIFLELNPDASPCPICRDAPALEDKDVALEVDVLDFIKADVRLYESILLFESVELSALQQQLLDIAGLRVGKSKLRAILDKHFVVVKDSSGKRS